jgi:DNA invertase Pin-like site-specific DNA recombinase|tara:strand:+ start:57 stop:689 length:633 start_codon:yes stop_codon:yes gene_type:complete
MDCYCYYRTSSSANADSGTWDRQTETCRKLAKADGLKVVAEFREVFTGTETDRPALNDLLAQAVADGIKVILVESADRLSRELAVQMALIAKFKQLGINCIDAGSSRSLTESADPVTEALTLIQGVFSQLEKKRLVSKLRRARDRASEIAGRRVEGRKPLSNNLELAETVKKLRRKKPLKKRLSWNSVSKRLLELKFGAINPEVLRRNFS